MKISSNKICSFICLIKYDTMIVQLARLLDSHECYIVNIVNIIKVMLLNHFGAPTIINYVYIDINILNKNIFIEI